MKRHLTFLATGDTGEPGAEITALGVRMAEVAAQRTAQLALLLGDNFYPSGLMSIRDQLFTYCWMEPFMSHAALARIPWKVVLGNHDYNGHWKAQLELATANVAPLLDPARPERGRTWSPVGDDGVPARWYTFKVPIGSVEERSVEASLKEEAASTEAKPSPGAEKSVSARGPLKPLVQFFALDTNAAQYASRRVHPSLPEEFAAQKLWLKDELEKSDAMWKVVFAHHPCYTKGKQHGVIGDGLRLDKYFVPSKNAFMDGLSLEKILVDGKVDFYFAGHEHVLQTKTGPGNIAHIGLGGSVEQHFYGGEDKDRQMDWFALQTGFGSASVSFDETSGQSTFSVDFIDVKTGKTLHNVQRSKTI
jgi:hypothetical protein